MNADRAAIASNLAQEFARQLSAVFETMAGTRPAISLEQTAAPPELDDESLCWKQPLPPLAGPAYVVAGNGHWNTAGQHVLGAAGVDEGSAEETKSTYLETIRQAMAGFAAYLTGKLHRAVGTRGGKEIRDACWTPATVWWAVRIGLGTHPMRIEFGLDPAIVDALLVSREPQLVPAGEPESSAQGANENDARTFDLLLDVELPVSVSFGRAHVPLKDVLKLTTGSIIELNRAVVEPVDIIVNNCVIARGDVVVVEGNFGVRIQQVVSRSERLRTL